MAHKVMPLIATAKGYICICGAFHQFAVWVYAHWHMPIDATCTTCGQHNTIVRGVRINDR